MLPLNGKITAMLSKNLPISKKSICALKKRFWFKFSLYCCPIFMYTAFYPVFSVIAEKIKTKEENNGK